MLSKTRYEPVKNKFELLDSRACSPTAPTGTALRFRVSVICSWCYSDVLGLLRSCNTGAIGLTQLAVGLMVQGRPPLNPKPKQNAAPGAWSFT